MALEPVPPIGSIIANDGTLYRSKSWVPDLRDFFRQYGGADDGMTPCDAALDAFTAALFAIGEGIIVTPATGRSPGYLITRPWKLYADASTDPTFIQRYRIRGTAGRRSPKSMFMVQIPAVAGMAARIEDYANGGAGPNTQTLTLDGANATVTVKTASTWIGRWIRLHNCATPQHNGEWIIVGVPADGQVRISNQSPGVAGTDAHSGSIHWRILQPAVDCRAPYIAFESLSFEPRLVPGTRVDVYMEFNYSPNAGAIQSQSTLIRDCHFESKNPALYRGIDGIWYARSCVPVDKNNYLVTQNQTSLGFSGAGVFQNGRGDFVERAPYQVDTGTIDDSWISVERMPVSYFSRTAQCKEMKIRDSAIGGRLGVGVPRSRYVAGSWTSDGSPHFDVEHCSFSGCDLCIQRGGTGSAVPRFRDNYGEGIARFYADGHNQLPQGVTFDSNALIGSGHPSGEYIVMTGLGPYKFTGEAYSNPDNVPTHFKVTPQTGHPKFGPPLIALDSVTLVGTSSNTGGSRARKSSTIRGPYAFNDAVPATFTVTSDLGSQNIDVTEANFAAAKVVNVTLDEVWPFQLGKMLDFFTRTGGSGARCWGEPDDAFLHIESSTMGAKSSLTVTGSAADRLGFLAGGASGLPPSAMETETLGMFQTPRSAGLNYDVSLTLGPTCQYRGYAPPNLNPLPFLHGKRYGATMALGPTKTHPGGSFTLSASATTTVNNSRITAASVIRFTPTNAAAAMLMGSAQSLYVSGRSANTSFSVTTGNGVAASGGEAFDYVIMELL